MASPRAKAIKVQYTLSEYQLLLQFVKTNLKHILNLISSEIQPIDSIMLSSSDLNALRVLFRPLRPDGSPLKQPYISAFAPFFSGASPAVKSKLATVSDWMISILSAKEKYDDIIEITDLCKAVTIYDQDLSNKDLKIANCEDCYLYINSAVGHVLISNCTNCTIMVAAGSKLCTIDKSERIHLAIAVHALRLGNSIDCKLGLYTVVNPILYGDSRAIHIGPHNVAYDELMSHVKKAKLSINSNNLQNWMNPFLMKVEKDCYTLQESKDFSRLELPAKFKENMHMLAPPNFIDILNERSTAMGELMKAIKDAKLTPEQQAQLHNAIQGHFREWVVSTNNIKPIEGLVKMIDESEFGKDI